MRRPLALLAVVPLVAALAGATPASADTTVTVHGIYFDNDIDGTLQWVQCNNPTVRGGEDVEDTLEYGIEPNDDVPPLGSYALELQTDGSTAAGVLGYTPTPSNAPFTMRIQNYSAFNAFETAIYISPADSTTYWLGTKSLLVVGNGATWKTLTSSGSYAWSQLNSSTGNVVGTAPAADLDDFAAAHGGDAVGTDGGAYVGWLAGCAVDPRNFTIDALRVGPVGSITTFDMERFQIEITKPTGPTKLVAGKAATLLGGLNPDKALLGSATFVLQARPAGTAVFTNVGSAPYTTDGSEESPAAVQVKPKTTTTYRWYFAGTDLAEPFTSATTTVKVRTALTIAAPKTAAKGKPFTVSGKTTPVKQGKTVTLQRKQGTKWVKVGTDKTDAQGRYAVRTKSTRAGTFTYRVVIGADSFNIAGTSATKKVKVS